MSDASSPRASSGATPRSELPAWLRRAFGIGPLVGSAGAGVALWLPTHDTDTAVGAAVVMFLVLGALRAADPALEPVWSLLGRIPRWVRAIAAVVLPAWYTIGQLGPDAAGQEVDRARSALFVSTVFAYVLLRPRPEPKGES